MRNKQTISIYYISDMRNIYRNQVTGIVLIYVNYTNRGSLSSLISLNIVPYIRYFHNNKIRVYLSGGL